MQELEPGGASDTALPFLEAGSVLSSVQPGTDMGAMHGSDEQARSQMATRRSYRQPVSADVAEIIVREGQLR